MTEEAHPAAELSHLTPEDLDEVAGGAFTTEFQPGTEIVFDGVAPSRTHCSGPIDEISPPNENL